MFGTTMPWITRCALLAASLGWLMAAHAGDVLPPHLSGTWGTAASLYEGSAGQSEMHLLEDGLGLMAGSTPPARRADGSGATQPGLRAIIGFPIRTKLDGDTLSAQAISPDGKEAEQYAKLTFTCLYSAERRTLTCNMPRGEEVVLARRSDTVPAEMARMIQSVGQAAR